MCSAGKFGANVRYIINVDRNGDAVQDLAYVVRFDDGAPGHQKYTVTRYTGANAVSLSHGNERGSGTTAGNGMATLKGDGRVFAGVRSDPFFFDLTGFVGTLFHIGSDALGDHPTDFFSGLNTNAIVIEVPDDELGGKIGVWGQTTWWNGSTWMPGDQMGRPAINTVFNNKLVDPNAATTKNLFNATPPSQQRTADGGQFRTNIITTLTNINAVLGTGHADYTTAQAQGLADFLLPDVLTYDTSTKAGGLNGRALSDDVIDIELGITTNGAVTSDGVGPHTRLPGLVPVPREPASLSYHGRAVRRAALPILQRTRGASHEHRDHLASRAAAASRDRGSSASSPPPLIVVGDQLRLDRRAPGNRARRPLRRASRTRRPSTPLGGAARPDRGVDGPDRPVDQGLVREPRQGAARLLLGHDARLALLLARAAERRPGRRAEGAPVRPDRGPGRARPSPAAGRWRPRSSTTCMTSPAPSRRPRALYQDDPTQLGALATMADATLELGDIAGARADYDTLGEPRQGHRRRHPPGPAGVRDRRSRPGAGAGAAGARRGDQGRRGWRDGRPRLLRLRGRRVRTDGRRRDHGAAPPSRRRSRSARPTSARSSGSPGSTPSRATPRQPSRRSRRRRPSRRSPRRVGLLGDLLAATGDATGAAKQFATVRFIEKLGEIQSTVYDRVILRFELDHGGASDALLAQAQASLAARPDYTGYDTVAWALYRLGRYDEAAAQMTSAMAERRGRRPAALPQGRHRARPGQRGRRPRRLQRALALGPALDPNERAEAQHLLGQ